MTTINLSSRLGKNIILNPLMNLWQRNTTFNPIANGSYCADRFVALETLATGAMRVDRSTDVPSSSLAEYSLKAKVTTAQPSVAAGEFAGIAQRVEGYNLRLIKGRYAVLVFWVISPFTGEHSVSFSNSAQNRTLVKTYSVTQANTWQKIVIRFRHSEVGTWDYENGIGLRAFFTLAAGSTYKTSSQDWQSSLYYGSTGQQNFFETLNNEFGITQIQMHEGIDEIPFSELVRDFQTEVSLCQRYYEKSYNLNLVPGTVTGNPRDYAGVSNNFRREVQFQTRKRTVPTVVPYNAATGAINQVRVEGTNYAATSTGASEAGVQIRINTSSVSGDPAYDWTADAEL